MSPRWLVQALWQVTSHCNTVKEAPLSSLNHFASDTYLHHFYVLIWDSAAYIYIYNDGTRLLLRAPRSSSASHMFVSVGVPTCPAVLRNLMFAFVCSESESENDLIAVLVNPVRSSVRFSSKLCSHWRTYLYVRYWTWWRQVVFFVAVCMFLLCWFTYFTVIWIPWVWNKRNKLVAAIKA